MGTAKQIWIKNKNDRNTWICFVKDFECADDKSEKKIQIAADSKYRLYLNGKEVVFEGGLKRGPARNATYYDEVDLTGSIKAGQNRMAILVCFFGDNGFSHISSGKGGLYVDSDFLKSDHTWKALQHPAYVNPADDVPSNFRLAESNEYFDAGKDIGNWPDPEYDVSDWQSADEIEPSSFGELVPRPIPFFKEFGRKLYVNAEDYKDYLVTENTTLALKLPYNAQIMPYLKITAPSGKKITVKADNYDDNLYDTKGVMMSYYTKEGYQEYEFISWINGETMFYSVPAGVTVHELGYRETGYNTEFKASFQCKDEFLNKLWLKSQRTLYITMRDNFMDCPDRERAQWWGDVNLEMQMIEYSLDDKAYMLYKKGVSTMAAYAEEAGHMITVVPSGKDQFELPMQNLAGIYGFMLYYKKTGDRELIETAFPMSISYLKLFGMRNGLVEHRTGSWDWPDWGDNFDVPVMENAWYYMALRSTKEMAELLGRSEEAGFCAERMNQIDSSFDKAFWTGEHYYSETKNGKPDDRANALAVLSGLASHDKFEKIEEILKTVYNSSPYMEYYVLEAMCRMGYVNDALERIHIRYADMVNAEYSTLWEYWNTDGTKNHAWSGGPLIVLSRYCKGMTN